jgi:hypothetical protein
MKHITRCLRAMRRRGATTFEVTQAANNAYVASMLTRVRRTVFSQSGCAEARSYYVDRRGQPSLV